MSDTLTSLGTTVFLAAAIFLMERRFVHYVSDAASRAAAAATREVVQDEVRAQTAGMQTRLDDLDERLSDRIATADSKQDTTVARLEDSVSFESVTAALQEAHDLNAFYSRITVPANDSLDGTRVEFTWAIYALNQRLTQDPRPRLVVGVTTSDVPALGQGRRVMEVDWRPTDPAEVVGHRLVRAMQRAGYGAASQTLDWPHTLRMLRRALADAVLARRTGDEWFTGDLLEWINPTWAVTSNGLFHSEYGLLAPTDQFPENQPFGGPASRYVSDPSVTVPKAPTGIDVGEWEVVYRRASAQLPMSGVLAALMSASPHRPTPITSAIAGHVGAADVVPRRR